MFKLESATGLEILDGDLILTTVDKRFTGWRCRHFKIVEEFSSLEPAELRREVEAFLKRSGASGENLILGLPSDQVVLRQVQLPVEAEENLDQVVRFQTEKLEPCEEDGSYYSYQKVSAKPADGPLTIQIAMLPKSVLDPYLDLFDQSGLFPRIVSVSSLSLVNLLGRHSDGLPEQGVALLFRVGPRQAELVAVAPSGEVRSATMSFEGTPPDSAQILRELCQRIMGLHGLQDGIASVYVLGAGAAEVLPGVRELAPEAKLLREGLKLEMGMPVSRLEGLLGSLGLALGGIEKPLGSNWNLIPPERRTIQERPNLVPTVALAGLFGVALVSFLSGGYIQESGWLSELDKQIEQLQPQVDQVLALREQVAQKEQQLQRLAGLMTGNQKALVVLKELTEQISTDSYLQTVRVNDSRIRLVGFAESGVAVLRALNDSECLQDVAQRYITPDRRTQKEKFEFEATLSSQCVE